MTRLAVAEITRKIRETFTSCSLGAWPTPLTPVPALASALGVRELWIKREDRSSPRYGGSKVRGLEFLLAEAGAGRVLMTIGGVGSTHCLATAVHGRALGCAVVLAQFPQPDTAMARRLGAATSAAATHVERSRWRAGFPAAVWRAWRAATRLGRPQWIPGGGAHPLAVVGQALGGLELASQLEDPPEVIVTALGSGGTAAGLCLAIGVMGWPTRVLGVRVAPWVVANRWRVDALQRAAEQRLHQAGIRVGGRRARQVLQIMNGLGRGYGYPTAAGERAQALAGRFGLSLDPTYTAKSFAVVPELGAEGIDRIVFWHTFAPPPRDAADALGDGV